MHSDCIFCKIIHGEIPSFKVYENESTFAFLDIHPINRGHTMVIPKQHHENIFDTPSELFAEVMKTAQMLAPRIKNAVGAEGINIGINNDKAAGQIIFHLHVHIIPRFIDDGHAEWHGNPYKDGEIESTRDIVIRAIK